MGKQLNSSDSEIKTFVLKEDKYKDGFFIGILKPFIIDPKEASGGPNRGDSGLKPRCAVDSWQLGGRGVAIIITGPDIDHKIR